MTSPGPPVPPVSTRVSDALVTKSSIIFRFNCSWFSDINGAIRFFAVVVTESEGTDRNMHVYTHHLCRCLWALISSLLSLVFGGAGNEQPDQQHPLPSYVDYRSNSSVRSYQTSYFPSRCSQGPEGPHSFDVNLGTGMASLGGTCNHRDTGAETGRDLNQFCDGPLKPRTAYRYC